MKIVLVNPNDISPIKGTPEEVSMSMAKYVGPSMTFPHLIGLISEMGVNIEIVDNFSYAMSRTNFQECEKYHSFEDFMKEKMMGADVIGINMMTSTQNISYKYIKIAKEISPKSVVVVGGPHTSTDVGKLLDNKYVDHIVVGKGEYALLMLVKSINNKEKPPKLIQGDNLEENKGCLIPNYSIYQEINKNITIEAASIYTSKGCIKNCKFCSRNSTMTKLFYKPINCVLNEITELSKIGVRRIIIDDDNFGQDHEYAKALLLEIIKKKLDLKFSIITRVDLISQDTMQLFRAAGGVNVCMAIETGAEELRHSMGKDLTNQEIYDAVSILRSLDINIYLYVMLGYPGETTDDIRKTEEMINNIKPNGVSVSIFHIHPGMPIFKKLAKEKNIPDDYFENVGDKYPYFEGYDLEYRKKVQANIHNKFGFSRGGFWKR